MNRQFIIKEYNAFLSTLSNLALQGLEMEARRERAWLLNFYTFLIKSELTLKTAYINWEYKNLWRYIHSTYWLINTHSFIPTCVFLYVGRFFSQCLANIKISVKCSYYMSLILYKYMHTLLIHSSRYIYCLE